MSVLFGQTGRALKCLLLALMVLFAQQAAQLHALGHAEDELAQRHHGQAPAHAIEECCIAFHAVGSALTATAALQDFDFLKTERASWFHTEAPAFSVYRLRARAPPQAV